ncbi:MAG: ADP-ribosylglycohydrolase family protein [Chloroflexia bacterium]|nr:ADP-ribosylglycohydrolase family protein [Chloroflexia bacterium]
MPTHRPTEEQFLGALLGLAIGDALGMPVAGMSAAEIESRHGRIEEYLPLHLEDGSEVAAGEITDETETALCIVESLTTNDGLIDPANIGARLGFLASTDSRRWLSPDTLRGIELAAEHDGLVPPTASDAVDVTVLPRGVPTGLMHTIGVLDAETIRQDAALLARLSHGGHRQTELAAAVALATRLALLERDAPGGWTARIITFTRDSALKTAFAATTSPVPPTSDHAADLIAAAVAAAASAVHFEDAVFSMVARGGATDTSAALAGALAGGRFGASGIPQTLIDGLGARIYISLAAPWLYRTLRRRAGTVIDLRPL